MTGNEAHPRVERKDAMEKTLSKPNAATLKAAIPCWPALWRAIKEDTRSKQRGPKRVVVTDEARNMLVNDYDCATRMVVDIRDGRVLSSLHVSTGENAINSGNKACAIESGIPANHAVVTVTWNDFYRCMTVEIQVAKGGVAPSPEDGVLARQSSPKMETWPNGLGVTGKVPGGEWEVLLPFKSRPAVARFIPDGEGYATMAGTGATPEQAIASATPVEM